MLQRPQWKWRMVSAGRGRSPSYAARVPRALAIMGLVYVLVNLGLGWAIQTQRLEIRDNLYTSQQKALRACPEFWAGDTKPRVVMFGSSRAQQAFHPEIFTQITGAHTYNFAIPGAGTMANALYLRRLFEQGLRTEVVFIEWHPGFTAAPAANGLILENGWLFDNRILPHEFPILHAWGNPRTPPYSSPALWHLNSVNQFRLELVNHFFPSLQVVPRVVVRNEEERIRGFCKGFPYDPAKYTLQFESSQRSYRPIYDQYRVGGPGWNALLDMIAVTRMNGAVPIVVLSAECVDVQALYGPEGNASIRAAFENLDCLKINGRDWVVKEQTADGHHLTEEGAKIYTEKLAQAWRALPPLKGH